MNNKSTSVVLVALTVGLYLNSCSSRVSSPSADLPQVQYGDNKADVAPAEHDPEMDTAVSTGCLTAWRKALAGKVDEAIADLKALDEAHPKTSTIQMMLGQVMEHAGRNKEAASYYHEALNRSRYSSLYLFKYAEQLRKTGDAKSSIPEYRTLLKQTPNFAPAHTGLAQSLLTVDKNSKEARAEIKQALILEPENTDAKRLSKQVGLKP
ncbi:MAG: tetratricopeptide repeat protein [Candidatus Obscuribacterales bacterium]|nr:tetratricopeptide repeat protein [Candidatus Obscuribacterales bacterium]